MPVVLSEVTAAGSQRRDDFSLPDAATFRRDQARDYVEVRTAPMREAHVTPLRPMDATCRPLPAEVLELSLRDSLCVLRRVKAPTLDECERAISLIPDLGENGVQYGPCRQVLFVSVLP